MYYHKNQETAQKYNFVCTQRTAANKHQTTMATARITAHNFTCINTNKYTTFEIVKK